MENLLHICPCGGSPWTAGGFKRSNTLGWRFEVEGVITGCGSTARGEAGQSGNLGIMSKISADEFHRSVTFVAPRWGDLQRDKAGAGLKGPKGPTLKKQRGRRRPREEREKAPLPVVVFELDVPAGLQHLPVPQPGELGLGLAPRLAGEDGGGAHRPSDRLRGLNELRRS